MEDKIIETVGELVDELCKRPRDNNVMVIQDGAIMCDLGIKVRDSKIFNETYIKIIQKEIEDE